VIASDSALAKRFSTMDLSDKHRKIRRVLALSPHQTVPTELAMGQ
jgi:hypothetical protein